MSTERRPHATAMCVRCLRRKATSHMGHVLDGRRKVTAGWCQRCIHTPGFFGHWLPAMNPEAKKATP